MARYNIRNIRTMLTEGFTPEELRELAYDEPDFRPVYDQLSSSAGKAEIIQRLIEFAERRVKMEILLAWAKERNPDRYGQDPQYSDSPIGSPPTSPVSPPPTPAPPPPTGSQWDVFISHASEDKTFVRQLADALAKKDLRVWLDELTMTVGDSLREEIDRGLANSRYGVVVLSPNFFKKQWAKSELDALEARQNAAGKKVILPVWHDIAVEQVMQYSPLLAGRLAVSSAQGLEHVVAELVRAIQ